jgi:hypothetical protein
VVKKNKGRQKKKKKQNKKQKTNPSLRFFYFNYRKITSHASTMLPIWGGPMTPGNEDVRGV